MEIELGPPVSESSTRISKCYVPTASEHQFLKTGIKKLATNRNRTGILLNLNCYSVVTY